MRLSLDWLKDFVAVKEVPEKAAEILTLLGFEVETIEKPGREIKNVITTKITKIRKHPQADRLQLATVTDGKKEQEVVCGATNIRVGQTVPLARVGTVLPGGRKIEKAKIRGVVSEGMLCSEKELGLGLDHEGIYILDSRVSLGQSLSQALGLNDAVLDITISPNRSDCFSVLGLAREYAAQTGRSLKTKKYSLKKINKKSSVTIVNRETKICPKYTAREIIDVKVESSPVWLKSRLIAAGVRPINNVVDATNYMMLETGQPIHAFDLDQLAETSGNHRIIIRSAKQKEKIKTLDGQGRELNPSMLIIADSREPIAVAGVMGGVASEVTPETKRVVLEVAAFDKLSVRKTSQQLGLRSESSTRFEKGIDLTQIETVSDNTASLIADLSSGKVLSKMHVNGSKAKPKENKVELDLAEVKRLLGIEIPKPEIKKYLQRLGFKVTGSAKSFNVTVPSWRSDIVVPADLIEEIGRMYGYNKLEPTLLTGTLKPSKTNKSDAWSEKLRDSLVGLGYSEVYNYSFYDLKSAETAELPASEHYKVSNPMSPDQKYLRASLIPRLKENLRRNGSHQKDMHIFEVGRTFHPGADLPVEHTVLAAAVARDRAKSQEIVLELKGVLQKILNTLHLNILMHIESVRPGYYKIKLGEMGEVGGLFIFSNREMNQLKLSGSAGAFGIRLDLIIGKASDRVQYQPFSQYPTIERDLAVIIDEQIEYVKIGEAICRINQTTMSKQEPNGLVADLGLFGEIYRGKNIGSNKKSLPIRIVYQSPSRTLSHKEVEKIQNKIISKLQQEFGAKIKGINN